MYAKIFSQIYDGTLCTKGPWQALVTFQQMLVLADQDGGVDMTPEAISRRTTIPLEIIRMGIKELCEPDPESRSPDEDGRRLLPLREGRSWGWTIVNYKRYRQLQRESERREYHRNYWHKRPVKSSAEQQNSTKLNTPQLTQHNQPIAEAEAEAEALRDVFPSLRSGNIVEPLPVQLDVEEDFTREKPKKAGYQVPQCPYDKIAEAYAQHLPSLPQIAVISASRKRAMQARWRDVCAEDKMTGDEALEFFKGFFAGVAKSKFLMGRANPGKDGRTFKADFDWLMVPANFLKVFEGRYHERSAA